MDNVRENQKSKKGKSALILIRTPFQAFIAKQVLLNEGVSSFHLLYFTQNNSSEDNYYFNILASAALNSKYFYAPKRRFDILGHLDFRLQARRWLKDLRLDLTLLSSIDSPILNAIAHKQSAELVTFDDGTANFFLHSHYHVDSTNWRGQIYHKLLGGAGLSTTKDRIARHYTLYPQFNNIVESERLRSVCVWDRESGNGHDGPMRTYFIGAPFEEVLTVDQIENLKSYVRLQHVDSYVKHPRESKLLDIEVPLLDKGGCIAEDAISRDAGAMPIHVIGWFSTVLFNLGGFARRRTMILFESDPRSLQMAELGKRAGCEIVIL